MTLTSNSQNDCVACMQVAERRCALHRAPLIIDVEALADFIRDKIESEPYQGLHPELASMGLALAIRDEFPMTNRNHDCCPTDCEGCCYSCGCSECD